jgi:hypothetical protein
MPVDGKDVFQRAEDLFVARSVIADAQPQAERLSIADLYRFLTDPAFTLTAEQQALLFADRRLRADYQRLKQDLSPASRPQGAFEFPRVAAASDRALDERQFPHGSIQIAESQADSRQVYVVFALQQAQEVRALILESVRGHLTKLKLEAPDTDGIIQLLLDTRNDVEAEVVRLLRDPETTGMFV